MEVRALDPAWAGCNGGIEGVYDPPGECSIVGEACFTINTNT
jgi:hypothetical protein